MSAYVPFEIQVEILKRVPLVKSLIRFTSVSKQWKSLIHSSEFITHHNVNPTQPHHLLLRYPVEKYVSIIDNDNFPHHKFSPYVSPTVKLVTNASMLDCSHGLVCFYGSYKDQQNEKKPVAVVWNPSIGKSVGVEFPGELTTIGCGVCPKTSDLKIVKITHICGVDWKAEVFTLSTRAWRTMRMNLRRPREANAYISEQVVIDGVIHWLAYDGWIVSFDLTSEEFGEIDLPNSLARSCNMSIYKLKDSLVVLAYEKSVYKYYEGPWDVWMMNKNGDQQKPSFTKLFTVWLKPLKGSFSYCDVIIGFRKNGQPITLQLREGDGCVVTTLQVYQPRMKHSNDLGTDEAYGPTYMMNSYAEFVMPDEAYDLNYIMNSYPNLMMTSYTESLLLLNHSDSIIQC